MFDAFVSLVELEKWVLKNAVPGTVVWGLLERLRCSHMAVRRLFSRWWAGLLQNLVFDFQCLCPR